MAFRSTLTHISADPLLRTFADIPDIDKTLESLLASLDACQTALYEFLELKRSQFPRCAACMRTSCLFEPSLAFYAWPWGLFGAHLHSSAWLMFAS